MADVVGAMHVMGVVGVVDWTCSAVRTVGWERFARGSGTTGVLRVGGEAGQIRVDDAADQRGHDAGS